ncbi:hypothetical protein ANO14919_067280 [Xylariales sp. No.14919]|nr:hypothetical protein ANO14919_067280 [Xylariales sp. No.14919]
MVRTTQKCFRDGSGNQLTQESIEAEEQCLAARPKRLTLAKYLLDPGTWCIKSAVAVGELTALRVVGELQEPVLVFTPVNFFTPEMREDHRFCVKLATFVEQEQKDFLDLLRHPSQLGRQFAGVAIGVLLCLLDRCHGAEIRIVRVTVFRYPGLRRLLWRCCFLYRWLDDASRSTTVYSF